MIKYCWLCGKGFEPKRAFQKYCSKACGVKYFVDRKERKLKDGRFCRQCGVKFYPPYSGGHNKQHCSPECSLRSARESRSKFYKRNPQIGLVYQKRWHDKVGTDGNLLRFYLRYPDAPRLCQSCGESRVLDIAHKPQFKRNGLWRSKANTTIDRVWILCPTCHALLDRKHYTPEQLNLKEGDAQ